jgi:hypothetical protein
MELLLSGAVVFGLAQLPGILGRLFTSLHAGLGGELRMITLPLETYVLLSVHALLGTFLLHLVLRAFWIGLLGLESVFPQGIRWHKIRLGAHTIRSYRESLGTLARSIDRADDLCSLIFSFGFLLVITFVYAAAILGFSALLAFSISHLLLQGSHVTATFWSIVGLILAIQIIVPVLDRRLGPRLVPECLCDRSLRKLVKLNFSISPLRWLGPIQLTLSSNLTEARVTVAVFAVMTLLAVSQVGQTFADRGALRLDNRAYFPPDLREHGLDPRHYRERRDEGAIYAGFPSIQAEVLVGHYLDLFLPYYPRRHEAPRAQQCPDLAPLRPEGLVILDRSEPTPEQVQDAASCLGSLFQIFLDGSELKGLVLDFAIEPGSSIPGLMVRISTRDLLPGRHELLVLAPPRRRKDDPPAPEPDRHLIPFWL